MEKEFIPYTLALDMKSIGFDEPCFVYWVFDGVETTLSTSHNKSGWSMIGFKNNQMVKKAGLCTAPTFSQAFRWFREKYGLVHTVYSNASGYMWELHYNQEKGGTHICDSGESGDCEMSGMFTTYEKAELECLKKLIELCKKN